MWLVFAVQTECVYCQIGDEFLCTVHMTFSIPGRAWPLVTGLSGPSAGFDPGPVHVMFVVHKVTPGQISSHTFRFSPVSIRVQSPLYININLLRTTGRSLRSFNRSNAFPYRVHWMEGYLKVVVCQYSTGHWLWRPWFDLGKLLVCFVMDIVAVGEIFLWRLLLSLSVSFH